MKKGLRRTSGARPSHGRNSNRRPDEEGIKTDRLGDRGQGSYIPTADLMKKGLRRIPVVFSVALHDSNRRPDEEGIKTGHPAHI